MKKLLFVFFLLCGTVTVTHAQSAKHTSVLQQNKPEKKHAKKHGKKHHAKKHHSNKSKN